MPLQPPPPPSISPRQMNLLRIVASMAWCDGHLATEEMDVMLDRFSHLFGENAAQQQKLRQELQDYLVQNIPLEELVPKLTGTEERELVLRLGYEVIQSSSRSPDEPRINVEEAKAYQDLVGFLQLPPETVARIEGEVAAEPASDESLLDTLTRQVGEFMQG